MKAIGNSGKVMKNHILALTGVVKGKKGRVYTFNQLELDKRRDMKKALLDIELNGLII
jgi:hypothetical protein